MRGRRAPLCHRANRGDCVRQPVVKCRTGVQTQSAIATGCSANKLMQTHRSAVLAYFCHTQALQQHVTCQTSCSFSLFILFFLSFICFFFLSFFPFFLFSFFFFLLPSFLPSFFFFNFLLLFFLFLYFLALFVLLLFLFCLTVHWFHFNIFIWLLSQTIICSYKQ